MSQSMYRKIGIASIIMILSVFLSRVIGLVREMVIAYLGGTGASVDAYQVAFIIPEILNHVLASGFLSITFIPIFTRYLSQDREADGWESFSLILSVFGVLLFLFILVLFPLAPLLLEIVGFKDPSVRLEAIRMTRIIIPAQMFFFLGGLFMAVQFAKGRFLLPALASPIYNLGIIIGGVTLSHWLGMEGFAWGALAGAFFGNFALQLIGARKAGMRFKLNFNLRHSDLKRYILLTAPLMIGLTMTFSTEIFSKVFGSYLTKGSVASLNYSLRLMFVLVGIFGQAAGVASYPFLSSLVAEGKMEEVNRLLNNTIKFVIIVIPFSVLMMVLRSEIIRVVFERGSFDAASTAVTSQVLAIVLIGAVAFTAQTVVTRGYYATQNTLFPSLFGSVAVLASVPLYIVGLKLYGIYGVALALSLSAILQVGLLYILWNRRTGNSAAIEVYLLLVKVIGVSVGLGVIFEFARRRLIHYFEVDSFLGSFSVIVAIGIVYVCCFGGLAYVLRIQEVHLLISKLKRGLLGK